MAVDAGPIKVVPASIIVVVSPARVRVDPASWIVVGIGTSIIVGTNTSEISMTVVGIGTSEMSVTVVGAGTMEMSVTVIDSTTSRVEISSVVIVKYDVRVVSEPEIDVVIVDAGKVVVNESVSIETARKSVELEKEKRQFTACGSRGRRLKRSVIADLTMMQMTY